MATPYLLLSLACNIHAQLSWVWSSAKHLIPLCLESLILLVSPHHIKTHRGHKSWGKHGSSSISNFIIIILKSTKLHNSWTKGRSLILALFKTVSTALGWWYIRRVLGVLTGEPSRVPGSVPARCHFVGSLCALVHDFATFFFFLLKFCPKSIFFNVVWTPR